MSGIGGSLQRGVTNEVRKWFLDAEPGDFLSYADMRAMWDLTVDQLCVVMHTLRKEGTIETGQAAWRKPARGAMR